MQEMTRRAALKGTAAVAAVVAVPVAMTAQADPLREGVQALVNEIREIRNPMAKGGVFLSFPGLQEAADRLEAMPGIEPVRNDRWVKYGPDLACFRAEG